MNLLNKHQSRQPPSSSVPSAGRQPVGSAGFTLIEVILVLAISSLLAIGLLSGQSAQTERARFTDAMERVVTSLEQAKAEARGTVGGTGGEGADEDRIVLGKHIEFEDGASIMTVQTLSAANTTTDPGGACIKDIDLEEARVVEIPWGVVLDGAATTGGPIVFARTPADGTLQSFVFSQAVDVEDFDACAAACLSDNDNIFCNPTLAADGRYRFTGPTGFEAEVTISPDGAITLEYED